MGCLFTSNIYSCDEFTLGGINQIFITNREWINEFYFLGTDKKKSNITSLNVNTGITWFEFKVNQQNTSFSEKISISNSGKQFIKSFDVSFNKMDSNKRSTLNELIDNGNLTIVYKDNNGIWWLMGDDFGSEVNDYNATTSTVKDNNFYRTVFNAVGKYSIRSIDSGYVSNYILPFAVNYFTGGTTYSFFSCDYLMTNPILNSVNRSMDSAQYCIVV